MLTEFELVGITISRRASYAELIPNAEEYERECADVHGGSYDA